MNVAFGPENVNGIAPEIADAYLPNSGLRFSEALQRTPNLVLPQAVLDFIDTWPSALQAGLGAVIYNNLTREATVPITFAWQPGYDYSMTVHDVTDTENSHGGITVVVTSRYPLDPHPLGAMSS
jgi:hypothetical protein